MTENGVLISLKNVSVFYDGKAVISGVSADIFLRRFRRDILYSRRKRRRKNHSFKYSVGAGFTGRRRKYVCGRRGAALFIRVSGSFFIA